MDWKAAQKNKDESYLIPEQWLHLHYYEALNMLFRMENSLRVFVYIILKNEFAEKWTDTALQTSETETTTIKNAASKRITQAKGFGYLGYEISSPLMFLNSGELTKLIFSEAYWNIFKQYFKGRKEIIQNKLEEISTVRNALAHFRPIKSDDLELVKQNIRHAFIGIEKCFNDLLNTRTIVPTNTEEKWYKTLTSTSSENCSLTIYQSESANWIRVNLTYTAKITSKDNFLDDDYFTYSILKLVSPDILKQFPKLASFCIYCSETTFNSAMPIDREPKFRKTISLIFSKDTLETHADEICAEYSELLTKIESEIALVLDDNLARGTLIQSVDVTVFRNSEDENNWKFFIDSFKSIVTENAPTEYWGNFSQYQTNFITSSVKYPWMPSSISSNERAPF